MMLRALWAVLLLGGCAYRTAPSDPFWVEVERYRPAATLGGEYEAQVRCLSGRTIEVWQCPDGATCRVVRYDCPNQ